VRIDRQISLNIASPVRQFFCRSKSGDVLPILMYHSITEDIGPRTAPYYCTSTTPNRFAEQMNWIAEMGYKGVSLSKGLDILSGRMEFSGQPVAITFDDGFENFSTAALPVLIEHHFTATMYVPSYYINNIRCNFNSLNCLTWNEVRYIHSQGIEIGSHTATHPVLYGLSWKDIRYELESSKNQIEAQLGANVISFAYPFAFPQADRLFVRSFVDLLKELRYKNSVTTIIGRVASDADVYMLSRLPMNQFDDYKLTRAKLRGAYDWLRFPQSLLKDIRFSISRSLNSDRLTQE
jgi:peptidoglycan/xylan/chitin deacetylase (PgdA/CDA1 family)